MTPKLQQNYNKQKITVFKLHNLYKIQYTQNLHPETLKNSEGDLFSELVSVVKVLKYKTGDKICVTMADLGKLLKAHGAPHHSSSTVRRCLVKLEQLGYITVARRRDGLCIILDLDRFCYWTRQTSSNITPTSVYISYPLSNCDGDDRTKNDLRVNSCNSMSYPTRATQDKFSFWKHPIVYTLMVLLKGHPDSKPLLARAEIETRAIAAGVELLHPSGVPWEHYSRHWQELDPSPGGPRELIAKNEILPVLQRALSGGDSDRTEPNRTESLRIYENHEPTPPNPNENEIAEIQRLIRGFTEQNSDNSLVEPNVIRSIPQLTSCLTDEEISVLNLARDRCRRKAENDT